MKLLIIFLCLLISSVGFSKEYVGDKILQLDEYRFTPHISADAVTRKQWGMSFQQSVGSNLNTNAFLKSLTVAVTDRVELGTVPAYYFVENHIFNISAKYNFWRTREYVWAVGFSTAFFDIEDDGLQEDSLIYNIGALQLLLNYFPDWTHFSFGLNLNIVNDTVRGLDANQNTVLQAGDAVLELGVDVSHSIGDNTDLTYGFGFSRESGVTTFEEVHFGLGASARWYRPGKFFSTPTVGFHYTPEIENIELLISTAIF